jgi:hypothetical protein
MIEPRLVELFITNANPADIAAAHSAVLPMKKRRAWLATCAGRSGCAGDFHLQIAAVPPATRRWAAFCANWYRVPR